MLHKSTAVILFTLSIDSSRQKGYNIAILGEEAFIKKAPPGIRIAFKGGATMAIRSDAQRRAVAKYNAANYERVELRLEKGKKDVVKAHAEGHGESLNGFINRAIDEAMERDGSQPVENGGAM